jgi:hypothetical protein
LGSLYGAGRSVKFDYGATDYLQNYSSSLYNPNTPTGVHQGEVGGALVEAAIIWAGSADGTTTAHSIDATTYADVSARSGRVTAKQRVTNLGNAMTRMTVKFAVHSASGRTLKSWTVSNVQFFPHQSRTYSYTYKHSLPGGACKVTASVVYGYPAGGRSAVSTSAIARGQRVRTH